MTDREPLFDLRKHVPGLAGGGWRRVVREGLEALMGLRRVRMIEKELAERMSGGTASFRTLRELVGFGVEERGVTEALPKSGSVIVAANHPFGGADAVALPELCLRVRGDLKVLANEEVMGFRAVRQYLLPLEILGGRKARLKNVKVLREAMEHVRGGGLLLVFPAGAVSYWQSATARVDDPPWPDYVARLLGKVEATLLPVWVSGRNPAWWQILARVHPYLRTGFLPRAFLGMRGKTVRCTAGDLIAPEDWPSDLDQRTRFLRRAIEELR